MEEYENISFPSEEMMVRLIEEQLWCGYEGIDASVELPLEDENATYLRETVFPTLVPALYELVRREQQRRLNPESFPGSYGATGNINSISWLSQYLLRNNTQHSKNLLQHPYVLVNNQVLKREKEAKEGTVLQ
ncbi:uncharacterized protein TM35_000171240 [Trypanosoma theileri]|uniref:Uncharacterized protein n=1 Tax=Trypanosoma theileri TaxID=67003 RepID=A0A1X0NU93_9TRYP|nr:uncharacterized protein TM35_000171240 [Trypanosoma theileri]ORC88252.1 hypothetical protein TM35_000171240 [Trypanosoma theileri]